MKNKIATDGFLSYLISTAFWINFIVVLFKGVISFLQVMDFIGQQSKLTSSETFVISLNFLILILFITTAYIMLSTALRFKIKAPFDKKIFRNLQISLAISFGAFFLDLVSSLVEAKYNFYLTDISHHLVNDNINFYIILLLIVTFLYKRGLDLQTENDLTI